MTGAALDVVDPALPALTALFDPGELSELLAAPVHADRVRHKRGVSAVARLRDGTGTTEGPRPAPRWIATYAEGHEAKLDKTLKRAAGLGYPLDVLERADGSRFFAGPIGVDMKLHRVLLPFGADGRVVFGHGAVLNYNPHRRVVFRLGTSAGTVVCKADDGSRDDSEPGFLSALAARGVPVLQRTGPEDVPRGSGLRYYPWFGQGDLRAATRRSPDHSAVPRFAAAAGAALAVLHAQPLDLADGIGRSGASGTAGRRDAARAIRVVTGRNTRLLPASAARLEAVHGRLVRALVAAPRRVLSHGDFSADQVLVDHGGEILLADFDRTATAPPGLDVGGFVASDLLDTPPPVRGLRVPFLEGYASAGGLPVEDLPAWVALQLLDRLDEPFRACSPDWRPEMEERLGLLERVLDGDLA